ncbi:MAG: hypothetical protein CME68_11335 [Halobacteriovoraceae bacterium]|nr:hypothetical protein [Halobacteriovoraceae bacterium]
MELENLNCFLIRGLGREVRHWGKFKRLMEKECSLLHCLELPGFGEKVDEISPKTIRGCVEKLRKEYLEVKEEHGKDNESILCSISLGGMIALDWMSAFPEDFKSGIVMNTSAGNVSSFLRRIKVEGILNLAKAIKENNKRERERNTFRLVSNRRVDEKIVDEWGYYAEEIAPDKKNFFRQLKAAFSFKVSENIDVPILFLASKRDRMVDFKCSEDLAVLLNASIEYNLDAGHDMTLDDPNWVINKMKNFDS